MEDRSRLPGLRVVGVVRSERSAPEDTPVQSALNRDEQAVVLLDDAYVDALDGLAGFDYAWLISWLGDPGGVKDGTPRLRQVPFLLRRHRREVGVFVTRGPRRVNPLGLSQVRILGVTGSEVRFAGVDLVDGTPVVDIKPYVARFDRPDGAPRCGWFDTVDFVDGATPSMLDPKG